MVNDADYTPPSDDTVSLEAVVIAGADSYYHTMDVSPVPKPQEKRKKDLRFMKDVSKCCIKDVLLHFMKDCFIAFHEGLFHCIKDVLLHFMKDSFIASNTC